MTKKEIIDCIEELLAATGEEEFDTYVFTFEARKPGGIGVCAKGELPMKIGILRIAENSLLQDDIASTKQL